MKVKFFCIMLLTTMLVSLLGTALTDNTGDCRRSRAAILVYHRYINFGSNPELRNNILVQSLHRR